MKFSTVLSAFWMPVACTSSRWVPVTAAIGSIADSTIFAEESEEPEDVVVVVVPHNNNNNNNNETTGGHIVGGVNAARGEFPYYAHAAGDGVCGAVLIATNIILTAAHCSSLFKNGQDPWIVGSTDMLFTDEIDSVYQESMTQSSFSIHPTTIRRRKKMIWPLLFYNNSLPIPMSDSLHLPIRTIKML